MIGVADGLDQHRVSKFGIGVRTRISAVEPAYGSGTCQVGD